jgi:hypothetical protein
MQMRRRWLRAAVGVLAAAFLGLGAAATPAVAVGPLVSGSGWITLRASFGDVVGDTVLFRVHATGSGSSARGTFTIVHLDDAGGLYAYGVGEITCASVADGTAATTGVFRQSWFRDFPGFNVNGTAAAITVADRGTADTVGFDYEFFGSTITPCQDVPPVLPVERGNFIVL